MTGAPSPTPRQLEVLRARCETGPRKEAYGALVRCTATTADYAGPFRRVGIPGRPRAGVARCNYSRGARLAREPKKNPGRHSPEAPLTAVCANRHPADVGEFTAEETAIRAEMDPADLDRYVSAGVIEPDADGRYSTGHVRRIRIARSLERSGLPIDGLAVAMRQGLLGLDFADTPTYERFDPLGHETFEQAAERCAVPVELLLTVRESMGYALPKPTDRIGQDELDVVPLLRFMVDHGCRQPVIERSLRTYGESLRRVAETEADWWNSELLQPLFRRGVTYGALRADQPAVRRAGGPRRSGDPCSLSRPAGEPVDAQHPRGV